MVCRVRHRVGRMEKALVLSDLHYPYHDPLAVAVALAFARDWAPELVVVNGDLLDFYPLSRFDTNPERITSLPEELSAGREFLAQLRSVCPRARICFNEGNHEARLTRYLWQHPQLARLDCLKLPELLKLAALKIEHRTYQQHLRWRGLLIEHGDRVRSKAAYTAAAMLEARGVSGVSGHTHRQGLHWRTDTAGPRCWAESGCLCRLDPEYMIGTPPWQQGLALVWNVPGEERPWVELVSIQAGRLSYGGQVWQASGG